MQYTVSLCLFFNVLKLFYVYYSVTYFLLDVKFSRFIHIESRGTAQLREASFTLYPMWMEPAGPMQWDTEPVPSILP